jgi:hypothetical protein
MPAVAALRSNPALREFALRLKAKPNQEGHGVCSYAQITEDHVCCSEIR